MDESTILVETRPNFRIITLNRPQRLNSFTEDMHRELKAALDAAEADSNCRAMLITGAGRGFCAGQDLNDRLAKPGEKIVLGATLEQFYNPLIRQLRSLPFPVIAAVNGVAAGAGANIALACDFVIAAKSATFLQAFSKIGLVPDSGGTWFLPRLVGPARARGLAMLAEPLTAEKAESWGLIWKCVEDGVLLGEAGNLVRAARCRTDFRIVADQTRTRRRRDQRSCQRNSTSNAICNGRRDQVPTMRKA